MRYGPAFLERIKVANAISVTGPQRSGTRIATKIIAHDLGRRFVGEEEYQVGVHEGLFARYLAIANGPEPVVIHAPALSSVAHHMPGVIVFMRRCAEEILRSQKRIDWAYEDYELTRYLTDTGPIAKVTYRAWLQFQKPLVEERAFDLDYDSLAEHPLWIPKDQRVTFSPHQTSIDTAS